MSLLNWTDIIELWLQANLSLCLLLLIMWVFRIIITFWGTHWSLVQNLLLLLLYALWLLILHGVLIYLRGFLYSMLLADVLCMLMVIYVILHLLIRLSNFRWCSVKIQCFLFLGKILSILMLRQFSTLHIGLNFTFIEFVLF